MTKEPKDPGVRYRRNGGQSYVVRLVRAVLAAGLLLLPGIASADGDGDIDDFAGGIRFTRGGTTFVNYDSALKTQLDGFWNTARAGVCTSIWQQLNGSGYAMPSQQDFFTCSFPPSGEMRAKALTGNRVGVKYVLHGAKVQSSHYPANPKLVPPSATYAATFDMEIGLEIDVSNTPFTIVGGAGSVAPAPGFSLQAQPQPHGTVANFGALLTSAVTASHFLDSWKHQLDILSAIVLQDPANKQYPLIALGISGGHVLVALDQFKINPKALSGMALTSEGPSLSYLECANPVSGDAVLLSVTPSAGETSAELLLQYLASAGWQDYPGVGALKPPAWKATFSVATLRARGASWRWSSKALGGAHGGWVPWCGFSVGPARVRI